MIEAAGAADPRAAVHVNGASFRERAIERVEDLLADLGLPDEITIVGGVEPGGGRRHLGKKALVAVAAEVRGRLPGATI
ncbi:MAG: hypothetical protein HC869_12995 [Rhodospirillales bacterium]|nr:hypothetical protein [Rhodospirillales bacterium]